MYHDRKEVRELKLPIRISEYELERLENLLREMGGQKYSRAYEMFLRGLELYEMELQQENKSTAA